MVRAAACCVVMVFLSGCAIGGIEVKGLVKDRDTGAPVEGALVQFEGVGQAATSQGGLYTVQVPRSDDPRAVYVEARGYHKTSEFRVFGRNTSDVTVLNFELVPAKDRNEGD